VVCFLPWGACTPCGHVLCTACWDELPKPLCPICRRELPKSSGAVPGRLAWVRGAEGGSGVRTQPLSAAASSTSLGFGSHTQRLLQRSPTHTSGSLHSQPTTQDLLEQLADDADAAPLPHKFAKKVRRLQRLCSKGGSAGVLEGALDCAETLGATPEDASCRKALGTARVLLSKVVAQQLEEMPLADVLPLAQRLSDLLLGGALAEAPVLPAVLAVALAAADGAPGASSAGWREVEGALRDLRRLLGVGAFGALEAEVAPRVAKQVFEVVRGSGLPQLPAALWRACTVLSSWPEAHRELALVLRMWVPGKLQPLAARWGQGGNANPRPSGGHVALRAEWWLEALTTATCCGLLERSRLVQLCDELAPGLARAGVRTESSSDMLVVARQLAAELAEQPGGVRYAPDSQRIYFRWPTSGGASESCLFQEKPGRLQGRLPLVAGDALPATSSADLRGRRLRHSLSSPELAMRHHVAG